MNGKGKPSTCYSDNPKMGKPYQSQAKGYRDGGRVPDDEDVLKNVDISASGAGASLKSAGYGGRVGVNLPLDKDRNLSVGVSGGGYREGNRKEFNVTGADVSYRKGDTTIGVEVGKQPGKMGDKRVMFKYKKEF
jgi:hypothetical protein